MKYDEYEMKDIFGWSDEDDFRFLNDYFLKYENEIEIRRFAKEVIDKLRAEGNEIYLITARGSFLEDGKYVLTREESNEILRNWLKENEINYDKLIISQEDKLETCLENGIELMIEDKPANINKISTRIPVICFNTHYNLACKGDNIVRCFSWYDIYKAIKGHLGSGPK